MTGAGEWTGGLMAGDRAHVVLYYVGTICIMLWNCMIVRASTLDSTL